MPLDFPVAWWLPQSSERIVSMIPYRDMIIVATDYCVYVIKEQGRELDDHEVSMIMHK